MDNDRIETLLLKLVEDVAQIKVKLDTIEDIKLNAKLLAERVDKLESNQTTHDKTIRSLEKRQEAIETFIRSEMSESIKGKKSIMLSVGIAVFSAVLSVIVNLL